MKIKLYHILKLYQRNTEFCIINAFFFRIRSFNNIENNAIIFANGNFIVNNNDESTLIIVDVETGNKDTIILIKWPHDSNELVKSNF